MNEYNNYSSSTQASSQAPSDPSKSMWKCSQFRTEQFDPEHLELIRPQGQQLTGHQELLAIKRDGKDMNGLIKDGITGFCGIQPVVCSGFVEIWPGRASVWAIFDHDVKPNIFLCIHRQVAKAIKAHQPKWFHRLEMTVLQDFANGHRWAKQLGFERRCDLRKYDQWKRDYTLYERIR